MHDENLSYSLRLELRPNEETQMWEAFVGNTFNDMRTHIGSICFAAVITSPTLKEAFMGLMRLTMEHILRESSGTEVRRWGGPQQAKRQ